MDDADLWTGPVDHPDRYRVALEAITTAAAGGEGIVYRAHDTVRDVDVALKLLTVIGIDGFDLLARRSQPISQIAHPSLMANLELFIGTALTRDPAPEPDDFDVIFSVADWVDGWPLPEVVLGAVPRQLLSYVADIARALDALHEYRSDDARRGVVHRDVKPSNVRVRDDGTAVLVDFGVARSLDHGDVTTGVGTYRWRAPEVLTGSAPVTSAVDAWGLGAIAYWCFVGQPPGLDGATTARERLLHTDGIQRLSDPDGVATHIASLLATNPIRRPHDLVRWAQRLEELESPSGRRRVRVVGVAVPLVIAICAVPIGLGVEGLAGAAALDRLTPTDIAVDERIVVVPFDSGGSGTIYGDIATIAQRSGASAVAFVDFDSNAFVDGASGRSFVVGSEAMARLAVAPLLDVAVQPVDGRVPVLTGYRVDLLASELAGVGVIASGPGDTVRSVVALARVTALGDGGGTRVDDSQLDEYSQSARIVVPGLFLRVAELGEGVSLSSAEAGSVRLGNREVPLTRGELAISWSDQLDGTDDPAVVAFADLEANGVAPGSIVLVGPTSGVVAADIDTPLGSIAPVFVQANAMNTILTERYVRTASRLLSPLAAIFASLTIAFVTTRSRRPWALPTLLAVGIASGWVIAVRLAARDGWRLEALAVPVAAIATASLLGIWRVAARLDTQRRTRALFADVARPTPNSKRTRHAARTAALLVPVHACPASDVGRVSR